jgi:hypothetical protein
MLKQFVWDQFYTKLLEQNHQIVEEATRQFALGQAMWQTSLVGLRELQHDCRAIKAQLDGLNASQHV